MNTKARDLRQETDEQLLLSLRDAQNSIFRMRRQSEIEKLEAPSEMKKSRREIARIKTILRLRELKKEKTPV